jgi:hypothetical protein
MAAVQDETGCDAFTASVLFDATQIGVNGGDNVGNGHATLQVNAGQMNADIPAHGFVVFEKVS